MSQRARVLVIDDDPLFRSVLSSLLRSDYSVQVASDGSEGFFRALEEPPDLAVIDIRMPNWDGLKTLKAFRAHPSLSDVKIVILTAHASAQTIDAATRAGADDFVVKTQFSPGEFFQKLVHLLPASTEPNGNAPADPYADNGPGPQPTAPPANGAVGFLARGLLNGIRPAGTDESRLQAILDDWE